MKRFSSPIAIAFFAVLFAVPAFAQVQPAVKIGLIDTGSFYDVKTGITKLVAANKQLESEFAAQVKDLQDGNTRLKGITTELERLQKLGDVGSQTAFTNKRDEGERLQRELEYKKTTLEAAVAKRREILVGPVSQDIGKGIDDFAKKNGFGAVFDVNKLAENGVLLFLADNADVTKEFIAFYNARTAVPALPK
ncbi:MAG: OmpH family outer membrane protein [Acidobacteriota bacterium]